MDDLTTLQLSELARLCHRAEDTNDDLTLNEVMVEVERRNRLDTYTSPWTGETYPTGNPQHEFHNEYMRQMAERMAQRRKGK